MELHAASNQHSEVRDPPLRPHLPRPLQEAASHSLLTQEARARYRTTVAAAFKIFL